MVSLVEEYEAAEGFGSIGFRVQSLRGRPLEEDVWTCPLCYMHQEIQRPERESEDADEEDPLTILMSSGFNLLEGVTRASTMCFVSKSRLLDHMETHHEIRNGNSRVVEGLLREYKLIESGGLLHKYLNRGGKRKHSDILEYWDAHYDGAHTMRECFNSIVISARGMEKVAHEYDETYRPDTTLAKELWDEIFIVENSGDHDFINDGDPYSDEESESGRSDEGSAPSRKNDEHMSFRLSESEEEDSPFICRSRNRRILLDD